MSVLNSSEANKTCEQGIGTYPIDDGFDSHMANKLAYLESYNKHLYRPNTYLHKWWARRCGTTFRLLLKHLVPDDVSREFYNVGGLEGKIVLDPMMGGGTTLHEAIRLGANVIGTDIDPIPVLQAKASLANLSLDDLESAFGSFFNSLKCTMDRYFHVACPHCANLHPMKYMLYGLQRSCNCGPAIFVDSLVIRQSANGEATKICERCHRLVKDDCSCSLDHQPALPPIFEKRMKNCSVCGLKYRDDHSVPFFERYVPIIICGHCTVQGDYYSAISPQDLYLIDQANELRSGLSFDVDLYVRDGPKSKDLKRRGVDLYSDLFSSRQLLYLHHSIELLKEFDGPSRLYLAIMVSTSLEFNSMLCGYKGYGRRRSGAIRHAFSHHAYSFPYTALENNPIFSLPTSGTLQRLFNDRIRKARLWAGNPKERMLDSPQPSFLTIAGEVDYGIEVNDIDQLSSGSHKFLVRQGSSTSLPIPSNSIDFIVTDPPYYDSVQYSDLATFFRVWLRQLVGKQQSKGIDWDYGFAKSAVGRSTGSLSKGSDSQYVQTLTEIFNECSRVLCLESGRLIFSYHHWNPDGWIALTLALKKAGFSLVNRYVVHAENPTSVHINNLNALTDDAMLVLAPKDSAPSRNWEPVNQITTKNSAEFCKECASMIGWMLQENLTDQSIENRWRRALNQGLSGK
jgi:DNA modification methylase